MANGNRFSGLMSGLSSSDKKAPVQSQTAPQDKPKTTKPMPKSKDPNYKQIGIYLPADVHQKMKIGSAITGLEMSAIAQAGIEMWLAKNVPNN